MFVKYAGYFARAVAVLASNMRCGMGIVLLVNFDRLACV